MRELCVLFFWGAFGIANLASLASDKNLELKRSIQADARQWAIAFAVMAVACRKPKGVPRG